MEKRKNQTKNNANNVNKEKYNEWPDTLRQKFEKDRERYNLILSLNADCFFEYNIKEDSIIFSRNNMFLELSGLNVTHCSEKIRRIKQIYNEDKEEFLDFLQTGEKETIEFRYVKNDGSYIWCMAKATVVKDSEGNPETLIGCITDIDEQKKQQEVLMEQAMLDPMTKLYSLGNVKNIIGKYLRSQGSFGRHSVLLINMNEFGKINQSLGYAFGDGVLNNIAEILKRTFREKDIIARVGGDDFLIFLKNSDDEEVLRKKGERLSELFAEMYVGELSQAKITCTIGIARYPQDGTTFKELFDNADKALCMAKYKKEGNIAFYDKEYILPDVRYLGGYFHNYRIEQQYLYEQGDFSREISDFALQIMSETNDVESAIKLLLDRMGKYFQCEHISLVEIDKSEEIQVSYCWGKKDGFNSRIVVPDIKRNEIPFKTRYFDKNGLFIAENTEEIVVDQEVKEMICSNNIKATLQCAFYEKGKIKGCISLDETEHPRHWLQEEITALKTITKIMSFYLLKLKVSEEITEKMENIRNFDALTGLLTETKFIEEAQKILKKNIRKKFIVLYMDVNKFKYLNDALGYEEGDVLLSDFAEILEQDRWKALLVARLSADNFALLIPYALEEQVQEMVKQLSNAFQKKVREKTISSSVFIVCGAYVVKENEDMVMALDNANAARKYIKIDSNKAACCFFDEKMRERIGMERDICNSMEKALAEEEFQVYLQPKIGLSENYIVGAEALTRWLRSDNKMMVPDSFIPLFEKNGFIVQVDFYVYEKVCQMLRRWLDEGAPVVPISVNVSRVHLNTPDFVKKIQVLVNQYAIPTELLEFELTESIFLDSTEAALTTMRQLRELGFGVSIDDFGAGFSSLNLLKDMATDVLKLDKEFFRRGNMKEEEKIIVSSIISMAKQLRMKVLSEGIETEMQSEFLKEIRCDMAQGYLYAKPMPIAEFEKLLKEEREQKEIVEEAALTDEKINR